MKAHAIKVVPYLLLLLLFVPVVDRQAKAQPISVILRLTPNPSPYLSDWTTKAESQLVISITNSSPQVQNVYFTGTITGDNGVSAQTKAGFKPPRPLQAPPNTTTSYTGLQLKGMFAWEDLHTQGVNPAGVERSGILPQGNYELCVDVRDFGSNQLLTAVQPSGCSPTFTITFPQPPIPNTPSCDAGLQPVQGQPILFSWTPAAGTPAGVQYRLRIVEVIGNRDPNDALQSATTPAVFEQTVSGNTYLLNPVQLVTPRRPGVQRFAWSVRAFDPANKTVFSNNGQSEACGFEISGGSHPTNSCPKCNCAISVSIVKGPRTGNKVTFKSVVKASCEGQWGTPPCQPCKQGPVAYKWSVTVGNKDVIDIDGTDDADSVNAVMKGKGPFVLYVKAVLTCSDGSWCEGIANYEGTEPDSPPGETWCGLTYWWCPGPPITVIDTGVYPKTKDALKYYRPGDLIALSAYAEDDDILMQQCKCPEGIHKKKHPQTPDELKYEWTVSPAADTYLIKPEGIANSVLFQLPYCADKYPLSSRVTLTISNTGKKIDDPPIKIVYLISASQAASKYKAAYAGRQWEIRDFTVHVRMLPAKADEPVPVRAPDCKEEMSGDCVVEPWVWSKGSDITATKDVTLVRPIDRPPDNLVVLHADASDKDDVKLTCLHKRTGERIETDITGVYDRPSYEWRIVEGSGSFPLGASGPSVVFRHTYGVPNISLNKVTIRCTVTNEFTHQYPDTLSAAPIEGKIKPRIQPVALVGCGDLTYTVGTEGHHVKAGSYSGVKEAGSIAFKKYEDAGYNARFESELTEAILEPFIKNPSTQAVMLLGHSNKDGMSYHGGTDFFLPMVLERWVREKWGCTINPKHPLIRDLEMLGCYTNLTRWWNYFFNLEKYYGYDGYSWNSYLWSAIKEYVEDDFHPLPPRIPDRY